MTLVRLHRLKAVRVDHEPDRTAPAMVASLDVSRRFDTLASLVQFDTGSFLAPAQYIASLAQRQ